MNISSVSSLVHLMHQKSHRPLMLNCEIKLTQFYVFLSISLYQAKFTTPKHVSCFFFLGQRWLYVSSYLGEVSVLCNTGLLCFILHHVPHRKRSYCPWERKQAWRRPQAHQSDGRSSKLLIISFKLQMCTVVPVVCGGNNGR